MADLSVYFPIKNVDEVPETPLVDIIPKSEWGGLPPVSVEPLELPVKHVRYTYTSTPLTTDKNENTEWVRKLQKMHMEKADLPDIQYNFLIGGEGTVYEGRGWKADSWKPKHLEHLQGKSIDIAYMGEFSKEEPNWEMLKAGQNLLKFGLKENYIERPYEVTYIRE